MKVLVTGATGFLGRYVVAALRQRGHAVRALVRPGRSVDALGWADDVEVVRADLCEAEAAALSAAVADVDAVIHLAAVMTGDRETQLRTTVEGTHRLLSAMVDAGVQRLVHVSSFSVYDWRAVGETLTEKSPIEGEDVESRDTYAVAKLRQEQAVRQVAEQHGWALTVLRPGAIWGDRNTYLPDIGQRVGPLHLLMGPSSPMKLTYVENCADLLAAVLDDDRAAGQTFNVTDGHAVSNWRYTGDMLRRSGVGGWRVPVPYRAGLAMATLASALAGLVGVRGKLPGILQPRRFEARFKPVRCSTEHVRQTLGWQPPLSYEQALQRCYEGDGPAGRTVAGAAEAKVEAEEAR